jgi:hypothetical protein
VGLAYYPSKICKSINKALRGLNKKKLKAANAVKEKNNGRFSE